TAPSARSMTEQADPVSLAGEFDTVRRQAPYRFRCIIRRPYRLLFGKKAAPAADHGRLLGDQAVALETVAPSEIHAVGRDTDRRLVDDRRNAIGQVYVLSVGAGDPALADQLGSRDDRTFQHRASGIRGGAFAGRLWLFGWLAGGDRKGSRREADKAHDHRTKLHPVRRHAKRKAPPDRSGGAFMRQAERGSLLFGSPFAFADVSRFERLVALPQVLARIGVGPVCLAFDPGQRIVTDRRFRTLRELGRVLLFRIAGEDQAFLGLAPRSADRRVAAVRRHAQSVHARAGAGGDEATDDHVLLEPDQRVLLALDRGLGEHAGGLLERGGRDERTGLQARLGDAEQHRSAHRRLLALRQLGVDLVHLLAI